MTEPLVRELAIVGPGAAGRSLGTALRRAGWPLLGFVGRTASAADDAATHCGGVGLGSTGSPDPAFGRAGLVVVAVRDGEIADVAETLAASGRWEDRHVLHLSGALPASVLEPLRRAGASCASFHPLMTFPPPDPRPAELPPDTPFFIEGDAAAAATARALAACLGCESHDLATAAKPLYHAAATIAGNLVGALLGAGAAVLDAAGVDGGEAVLAPLARESVLAAGRQGAAGALTGPVARGDAETLRVHVEALARSVRAPVLREAHAVVSLLALELVRARGGADPDRLKAVAEVLQRAAAEARGEAAEAEAPDDAL